MGSAKRHILDFKTFHKDAKTKESYPEGNGSQPDEIKIKNDNLKESEVRKERKAGFNILRFDVVYTGKWTKIKDVTDKIK